MLGRLEESLDVLTESYGCSGGSGGEIVELIT